MKANTVEAPPKTLSFFDQVDRLIKKCDREFGGTKKTLNAMGWTLRPCSTAGMWRARRWDSANEKTLRIYAPTSELLIAEAEKEFEPRKKRKEERAKRTAEKKAEIEAKRKARLDAKLAKAAGKSERA